MEEPRKILLSPLEISENRATERITPEAGAALGGEPGLRASRMRLSGLSVLPSCTLPYNLRSTKPLASGPERKHSDYHPTPLLIRPMAQLNLKSGEEIETATQEQT